MLGQKRKKTTQENNNTTWGNKPENTVDKRKIKKILRKFKTILTKQDILNQRKIILQTSWGTWHKYVPTTGCKRNRTILT